VSDLPSLAFTNLTQAIFEARFAHRLRRHALLIWGR